MKFILVFAVQFLLYFNFSLSTVFANEPMEVTNEISTLTITWTDLLPIDAFDFIPEGGVKDEMWTDPDFLLALKNAGLATLVTIIDGKIDRPRP